VACSLAGYSEQAHDLYLVQRWELDEDDWFKQPAVGTLGVWSRRTTSPRWSSTASAQARRRPMTTRGGRRMDAMPDDSKIPPREVHGGYAP